MGNQGINSKDYRNLGRTFLMELLLSQSRDRIEVRIDRGLCGHLSVPSGGCSDSNPLSITVECSDRSSRRKAGQEDY